MISRRSMFGLALLPAAPAVAMPAQSYEYRRLASYWCMLCAHYAAEYPQMRPAIAASMERVRLLDWRRMPVKKAAN